MAFRSAPGYGNLPQGNFSPVIYSKKVQSAFRKSSTANAITNNDYFGEISAFGDSVKIIKEPEISVAPYSRGTQVQAQDLDDSDFTLVVDQANYFAFRVDDIETSQSHINWESLATDRAAYRLKDQYDQEILGYLSGYKQAALHENASAARVAADIPGTKAVTTAGADELLASMKLSRPNFGNLVSAGSTGDSIPIAARLTGATALPTTYVSPLQILNRMSRLMTQQNVPQDGRWVVVDPVFCEILVDESNVLVNADFGASGSELTNGMVARNLAGFTVYKSNNLPSVGTGPATVNASAQSSNFGIIVAGHRNSVATAEQLNKTESYRSHDSFGDVVRGMHLYGRKILRPEAISVARYNLA